MIKDEVSKTEGIEIEFITQKEIVGMADAILLYLNHIKEMKEETNRFFVTAADVLFLREKLK